jgi:[ribosomal protein S5]-alanine N-acetyltransferase
MATTHATFVKRFMNLTSMQQPELTTDRLLLRSLTQTDAPQVQQLAGDEAIAATALNIPHPFEDGMAEAWIATHESDYTVGKAANWAIVLKQTQRLIGAVGLSLSAANAHAELGYWIGKPYWGKGYASEAAQAVIKFGFETLTLHRIYATCLGRNPASGRVLQKLGMIHEGSQKQHVYHWGQFEDLELYGLFKE